MEGDRVRVALLYPEVYDMARFKEARREFPPFGVLYLASVIEQAGHEAVIEVITPDRTVLDLKRSQVPPLRQRCYLRQRRCQSLLTHDLFRSNRFRRGRIQSRVLSHLRVNARCTPDV